MRVVRLRLGTIIRLQNQRPRRRRLRHRRRGARALNENRRLAPPLLFKNRLLCYTLERPKRVRWRGGRSRSDQSCRTPTLGATGRVQRVIRHSLSVVGSCLTLERVVLWRGVTSPRWFRVLRKLWERIRLLRVRYRPKRRRLRRLEERERQRFRLTIRSTNRQKRLDHHLVSLIKLRHLLPNPLHNVDNNLITRSNQASPSLRLKPLPLECTLVIPVQQDVNPPTPPSYPTLRTDLSPFRSPVEWDLQHHSFVVQQVE